MGRHERLADLNSCWPITSLFPVYKYIHPKRFFYNRLWTSDSITHRGLFSLTQSSPQTQTSQVSRIRVKIERAGMDNQSID